MKPILSQNTKDNLYFWGVVCASCTQIFHIRLNSIAIIFLIATWLLAIAGKYKEAFFRLRKNPLFWLCFAVFMSFIYGYFISEDRSTAAFFIEKKLSLIVLPLVLLTYFPFTEKQLQLLFKAFITSTLLLLTTSTLLVFYDFLHHGDLEAFFYHNLLSPFHYSAIIASLYCLISLVLLQRISTHTSWKWIISALLIIYLILLSSRLMLLLLCLFILVTIFRKKNMAVRWLSLLTIASIAILLIISENPIKKRYLELSLFYPEKINASQYQASDYFDGLSLRLLYIRFSFEILTEHKAWLTGVGTGDADKLLQEKIRTSGMYTGNPQGEDQLGYLRFTFHNQYLQTLVQTGIPGLLLLVSLLGYCWVFAIRNKNQLLWALMTMFSLCFFTDDWMEFQAGLVSFLMWILISVNLSKSHLRHTLKAS